MTGHEINIYCFIGVDLSEFHEDLGSGLQVLGRARSEARLGVGDIGRFQAVPGTFFEMTAGFVHTLSSTETPTFAWSRRMRHDKVLEGRLPIGAVAQGGGGTDPRRRRQSGCGRRGGRDRFTQPLSLRRLLARFRN